MVATISLLLLLLTIILLAFNGAKKVKPQTTGANYSKVMAEPKAKKWKHFRAEHKHQKIKYFTQTKRNKHNGNQGRKG